MDAELADQHRKKIIADAEVYRKMAAKNTGRRGYALRLAGRIANWLDVRIHRRSERRLSGTFRPRISH
jgi:hypothetical protein